VCVYAKVECTIDVLHSATHSNCNTLQHTATLCNTLQHTATHGNKRQYTLQHTANHCNTLQHSATHCNQLQYTRQHTATHCNTLQHSAAQCNQLQYTLQHTAPHCNTLQHPATPCNTLQHTATPCNTLQHTATFCNTMQRTATHCNTLQHTATYTATYTATHCNTQVALTDSIEIGEMLSSQRRHLVSRTTLWEQLCSVRWHRGLTNRCKSEALRFWIQSYRVAARRRIVCREIASFRWSKTLGCILCVWRRGTHLTAPRRTHQRHQLVGLVFSSHEHFSHEHFTFLS